MCHLFLLFRLADYLHTALYLVDAKSKHASAVRRVWAGPTRIPDLDRAVLESRREPGRAGCEGHLSGRHYCCPCRLLTPRTRGPEYAENKPVQKQLLWLVGSPHCPKKATKRTLPMEKELCITQRTTLLSSHGPAADASTLVIL